jgi:nucleoside-diphosphate-sugar epimerase
VKVLVTGARGMLGGAVARALAARGDEVTVLQRGTSGLPLREVRVDLADPGAPLAAAVRGQDAVVHLAAKVDVVGPWQEYTRTNVEGTRRLLAAAREARVQRFVHVSSPSVGHAGAALVGVGAAPADPARARGHYARSKALAEQVVLDEAGPPAGAEASADAELAYTDADLRYTNARPAYTNAELARTDAGLAYRNAQLAGHERATRRAGTRNSPNTNAQLAGHERATRRARTRNPPAVVVVRPHLVWGPGDTQLVGRIVARARAGRLAVVGTGAALIDTTYVDDAVDALVAALDRAPALHGRVLVVSGGEPRPVAELLASICAAADAPAPRLAVPAPVARAAGAVVETVWPRLTKNGDPPMTRFLAEQLATAHWFDQRETRAALGWVPRVGLDEGFRRLRAAGSW